jgi:Arylsulfotransferase (ASST)
MMLRTIVVALVATLCLASLSAQEPAAAAAPTHQLSVSGTGVGMYPAYRSSVSRYAATTTQATFPSDADDPLSNQGASITVAASTSDPDGKVLVNGVPVVGRRTTVPGVAAGDEISVVFVDSAGREADAIYVLPAGFPELSATVRKSGITPGLVGLTLLQFTDDSPYYAAFVDENGVPAWSQASRSYPLDLKRQPDGSFSVSRNTTTPGRTGSQIVQLDGQFTESRSYETVGLTNTDNHDSILEPDGSRVLIAYEPNAATGKTDSVIQEVDAAGTVVFQWDSSDLVGESVVSGADYAHINSVSIINGGQDFLASFRHLSAVLAIARTAHDGYQPGDIVWKLGGRDSTFTFVDDPYGGPCAQHTASQLPNGDIMVFDDGSGLLAGPLCVDPDDPAGPPMDRAQSRIAVWHLDAQAKTATLVREFAPSGWYSWFMGSAQYQQSTGNIVVGWAAATQALASEISSSNTVLWQLEAQPNGGPTYITYRAQKYDVPDGQAPRVTVTSPAEAASYELGERVATAFTCTDVGGSTLQTCGRQEPGRLLDTSSPGEHTFRVRASDGAGNTATVTRHYTVGPVVHRPDVMVKAAGGTWQGRRVYGGPAHQTARSRVARGATTAFVFRLANRGNAADRCLARGARGTGRFRVAYTFGGRDVTRAIVNGTWRSPLTAVGMAKTLRARVHVTRRAPHEKTRTFTLRCVSPRGGPQDVAGAKVAVR